jgi:elongation factor G
LAKRCNIGIFAHVDAGKTTVTENLLYLGGLVRRPGSVDAGTTVTDWMVEEQERGITIASAASTFPWRDAELTVVDTPGHVDFTVEVERALRVIDGAVLVLSAPDGVQAQTETVWAQRGRAQLPAVALINKLDAEGISIDELLAQIQARLEVTPVPLQVAREGDGLWRIIEVLDPDAPVECWRFADDGGREAEVTEEEPDELDEVLRLEALDRLVDAVASHDDAYAEAVLAGQAPSLDDHLRALRLAVRSRRVLPLVFGAARYGLGISRLADTIVELLPRSTERTLELFPVESPAPLGVHLTSGDLEKACVYVFKTEPRPNGRRLAFVRVFAGRIERGMALVRTPDQAIFDQLLIGRVTGRDVDPIEALEEGQIGVLVFTADTPMPRTGDTLGLAPLGHTLERVSTPTPVLEVSVEAPDTDVHQRLIQALQRVCVDDPSLRLGTERETGRLLLAGMGELHLEVTLDRVRREIGADVRAGRPQIRRRLVLRTAASGEASVQHPAGRARVALTVEVAPHPSLDLQVPELDRPDWRGAILSGLESAAGVDGTGNRPLLGGAIRVVDVDLSGPDIVPVMLRDAAEWAALRAIESADPVGAEPWARLVVVAPDAAIGRLVGELARRRARLKGSESRGTIQVVTAEVPLSDLIGFATDLRSMTAGRGQFSMTPLGYRSDESNSADEGANL